jgi:uncharacterized protein
LIFYFFSNFQNKIKLENIIHQCRLNCGACCIAPSISSPIPEMPNGKPAGVQCIHLTKELLCGIFDSSERPNVCIQFSFDPIICGENKEEAMQIMNDMEKF